MLKALSGTMKQSVGVVERHTEVVKPSAIVSLECSIFASWSIIEDISPNCLTILHRVVHSQRFMAGLWNVLGLLHLQQGCDEIEKTHKKKTQPNKQKTDLRSTWPCAPCSSDSSKPTRGSEVNGRREEDECRQVGRSCAWARKWEWRKLCGNPPHPPPFLAVVHVKNVVKYYNTGGCLMSPLKEQSGV